MDPETYRHDAPIESQEPALTEIWGAISRRWWLIVLTTVIAAGGTYAAIRHKTPRYTASVLVTFETNAPDLSSLLGVSGANSSGTDTTALPTAAALAITPSTAQLAASKISGGPDADTIEHDVSASAGTTTNIVTISASSRTRSDAVKIVNAYAEAYAQQLNSQFPAAIQQAKGRLQGEVASATASKSSAAEIQQLQTQLGQLSALSALTQPVVQTGPAATSALEANSAPSHTAITAGLIGLIAGLILAFILDRLSPRVRRVQDVARLLDAPYMGSLSARRRVTANTLVFAQITQRADPVRIIGFAAVDQHHQRTAANVTAQVARVLTASGFRVCLLDMSNSEDALRQQLRSHPLHTSLDEILTGVAGSAAPEQDAEDGPDGRVEVSERLVKGSPGRVRRLAVSTSYGVEANESAAADDGSLRLVSCDPNTPWTLRYTRDSLDAALSDLSQQSDVLLGLMTPLDAPRDSILLLGPQDGVVALVRGGERQSAIAAGNRTLWGVTARRLGVIGVES